MLFRLMLRSIKMLAGRSTTAVQRRCHTRELVFALPKATSATRSFGSYSTAAPHNHRSVSSQAVNDMLAGLRGFMGGQGAPAKATQGTTYFSDNAPSWDELGQLVNARQEAMGLDFTNPDLENGPTSPMSLKRTFGKPDQPIRVKFYRDHAAWCPYCQKVWLQLEEKQIPYTMEKINMRCYGDKPPSFTAKVPSGLLPVLELDGRIVTESGVIMALLEDSFPANKPLMPAKGTPARARADKLMRLERKLFSDWMQWLTSDWQHERAMANFENTMNTIERELQVNGGPYFMGPELSLVDVTFASILERIAASIAYYKGMYIRGRGTWPAVDRWFDAMESRPTYLATRSDYYTHCHDLPPQLGGCAMVPAGQPVAREVDGGSWHLPLLRLSKNSMPEPYSPGDDPARDTLEAASKMVRNHQGIVRFALRGPGKPGPRPVSAPLADPTAIPDLDHTRDADVALRHVVHALLVGVEAKQVSQQALQVSPSAAASSACESVPAVRSAEYLRDRVGVPRDMTYPAARQLRAYLNWFIDTACSV